MEGILIVNGIRVLFLTQWFDPEPTIRGIAFARELVKQGFEVEVLTGFPNYPGGKLYSGYRLRLIQRELIDGVHITRVLLYPNHDKSSLKRVLNYISFAFSASLYGLFIAKRPDVIYAYQPPLTVGLSASIIKNFKRVPVVYDIQDMWPDTLRAAGMITNRFALGIVSYLCRYVYRRMNHIVVLSPGFKRLLMQRGVPKKKLSVIFNWADEASLSPSPANIPYVFPRDNRFCILFAGNMGNAQALDTVLDAASLQQERGSRVCWLLLGGGVDVDRLKSLSLKRKLSNVIFLPPVPMSEVGAYLHASDALLVHLRKDPLFEITIPSKTQAYMLVGKPILMAVEGDAADIVLQSGGGVLAESENAISLSNAADSLANMHKDDLVSMGENARDFYRANLSLSSSVLKYSRIFEHISIN